MPTTIFVYINSLGTLKGNSTHLLANITALKAKYAFTVFETFSGILIVGADIRNLIGVP